MLIGGFPGAGKSTLAREIHHLYGEGSYHFDFGNIYTKYDPTEERQAYRDVHWANTINTVIGEGLRAGNELVITSSAFLRRERRDSVLNFLSDTTRKLPIILGTPLLTSYHRIKSGRPAGTHTTDSGNVRNSLVRACDIVIPDDHTDILLPTDRDRLPGEYIALFNRNAVNKALIHRENLSPTWVMTTGDVSAQTYVDIVRSGIVDPFEIRRFLEQSDLTIEGHRVNKREL